ncbi:MAG: efflux RND transporter periplasmic adaptor subunit [Xanthomonadales bacterium]|nr:efflux RND transporter periplasmic adaptor subunit [Xanthomonadales bacterium]
MQWARWLGAVFWLASASAWAQGDAVVRVAQPVTAEFGDRFTLSGTVVAQRRARLSPRVDGLLAELRVETGDVVAAGELLLRQDDTVARLALARLQAQTDEAQAAVAEAERLLVEARQLVQGKFVPTSTVATRQAELALAQAALASAKAAAAEQAEMVQRHRLPAPFAGVIAARHVERGEWLQRGGEALELVDPAALWIEVQVPQERHAELQAGARYQARLAGQPAAFDADVAALLPVVDAAARTFLLRLQPSQPTTLLAGGSVEVEVILPASEPALAVSRDALLRRPDGSHALFVVEDGDGGLVARERSVRVLREVAGQAAIAAGLNLGDRVVIRGNEALRDGQRVQLDSD